MSYQNQYGTPVQVIPWEIFYIKKKIYLKIL